MSALTPAFVLHSRPYRETSSLVTFFSERHGKVSAVARGARAKRSQWKGILQPAVPLLIDLAGKAEGLMFLRKAEAETLALPLFGKQLFSAFYINELLYHLLDEQSAYPLLYQYYQQCLMGLAQGEAIEPWLREFEFHLFAELGYAVYLPSVWQANTTARYVYHLERGFEQTIGNTSTGSFSTEEVKMLCEFQPQQGTHLKIARRFCRFLVAQLLQGRELHSRQLFQQYQSAQPRVGRNSEGEGSE